ncbi:glutathione S-transferase [Paraphaeosphaeria sporulosa]|uniref:Glutathione S-transferase n=1 Tax=Paraphaeosphaeria sporulosa TaxID=1460663 RepID=A0A177CSR5_9PLEO|nr:glutathione S-transferase [Paraphaeosphaeria sporulosa]OAG10573.1 glutathione S-transferase [Paraphaeosphaeria sporulosa]
MPTITGIELLTAATPNGQKISILLEELGIPRHQRSSAIIDHSRGDFAVFESGAVMLYLVERSEMLQWLFFQNAGLGPMQGQANHFVRYAPERIAYAAERYQNETRRLYAVLDERLQRRAYLAGRGQGRYSIADIAAFAWVPWAPWAGVELDAFPAVKAWAERIEAREGVKRGLRVPAGEDQIERLRRDPEVEDPFKGWVMMGQSEVREKHGGGS